MSNPARSEVLSQVQEFLKRIPSASALSSQLGEEAKPNMLASGSNTSLFGFGSSNLECSGVPRVASLDMLRSMVDQDEKNRSIKRSEGAVQFTGAPEQAGPAQSPTSLRQQPGANAQLFQPSGPTIPHPAQSLAQSMSLRCLSASRLCILGLCRAFVAGARGKCCLVSIHKTEVVQAHLCRARP